MFGYPEEVHAVALLMDEMFLLGFEHDEATLEKIADWFLALLDIYIADRVQ